MSDYPAIRPKSPLPVPQSGSERLAAALAHASPFLAMPVLVPLAVLLLYPALAPASAYVRYQAMQALAFHLFVTVVLGVVGGVVAVLWAIILIGWLPAIVLGGLGGLFGLWAVLVEVFAVIKAAQGLPYGLPVVKNFGR